MYEYYLGLPQDSVWKVKLYTLIDKKILFSYTSDPKDGEFFFGVKSYETKDFNYKTIKLYSRIHVRRNTEYERQ